MYYVSYRANGFTAEFSRKYCLYSQAELIFLFCLQNVFVTTTAMADYHQAQSAILFHHVCHVLKAMMRGRGGCYKHTFYGIESHRCMEATPSLACANKCVFCWRYAATLCQISYIFRLELRQSEQPI